MMRTLCLGNRILQACLAACLVMAAGCKPSSDGGAQPAAGDPAEVDPAAPDPKFLLVASLDGVWATRDPDDGGRVEYMLGHEIDHEMLITRNGAALDLQNESVDPDTGTVVFHFNGQGPEQRLTFRTMPSGLTATYADGEPEQLVFVRALTDGDIAALDAAYEKGAVVIATAVDGEPRALVQCGARLDFRTRVVCREDALRALDQRLAGQFHALEMRGIDAGSTLVAANRQLDACASNACLHQAYGEWIAYLERNYPAAERGD